MRKFNIVLAQFGSLIGQHEDKIKNYFRKNNTPEFYLYPESIVKIEDCVIAAGRNLFERFILVISAHKNGLIGQFEGTVFDVDGVYVKLADRNNDNINILKARIPWLNPISLKAFKTTIGCGDRIGLATPGHLLAIRNFDVAPVLAQQSIRELSLTGRTYRDVVNDAAFGVFQFGYRKGYGADGDHLKTMKDIAIAVDEGMPMITLDLTDYLNVEALNYTYSEVINKFEKLSSDFKNRILTSYLSKKFILKSGVELNLNEETLKRCALIYSAAIDFSFEVNSYLQNRRGSEFDLEISIDETSVPTLPEHHLYVIKELLYRNVIPSSIAPKFIGEFQKGIDYIGDVDEFEKQFILHCDIAATFGSYKISVHSGSDKFKIFSFIGKHTNGYFHLKTAGTSWLEALRVISIEEPFLFYRIYKKAIETFPEALKLYHISSKLSDMPDIIGIQPQFYPELLENIYTRQLLHITYGYILRCQSRGYYFFSAMHSFENEYYYALKSHFTNHLNALKVSKQIK